MMFHLVSRSSLTVTDISLFCSTRKRQKKQEILVAPSVVVQVESCCPLATRYWIPRFDLREGLDHRKVGLDLVWNHRIEEALGAQALVII